MDIEYTRAAIADAARQMEAHIANAPDENAAEQAAWAIQEANARNGQRPWTAIEEAMVIAAAVAMIDDPAIRDRADADAAALRDLADIAL